MVQFVSGSVPIDTLDTPSTHTHTHDAPCTCTHTQYTHDRHRPQNIGSTGTEHRTQDTDTGNTEFTEERGARGARRHKPPTYCPQNAPLTPQTTVHCPQPTETESQNEKAAPVPKTAKHTQNASQTEPLACTGPARSSAAHSSTAHFTHSTQSESYTVQ